MNAADRQYLRALVDSLQHQRFEHDRKRRQGVPCAGCGGRQDTYTDGCRTCQARRKTRARRAFVGKATV